MELLARLVAQVDSWSGWLVGSTDGRSTYALTRWLFLRLLGLIYLVAFVSLWVQVKGLIGRDGIAPAYQYLQAVRGFLGPERYRFVPTVFWFGASDLALTLACALGAGCALLLIGGVAPLPALVTLWVLYLSLVTVGGDFLAFQWDVLLLEAGFLAIFVAPARLWPGHTPPAAVSATALVLLWWLLFRLTFQSGLVKLTWGDSTWPSLTALDYHFYTQPLPTWTAWYAQQLPEWVKRLAVLVMFVLELAVPMLIFGPRAMRLIACAGIIVLQLGILVTGNYTFFNLLTIALALLLVDDAAWAALLPQRFVAWVASGGGGGASPSVVRTLVAALIVLVSGIKFWQALGPNVRVPRAVARLVAWTEPFRSINSYGLFRVMTTSRLEIVVEGSEDGVAWRPYEFRYKPGDVMRRPAFVEPHQPRLDWQMWFAALGTYETTRWFPGLLGRLLEGSPAVLGLLARNPFPAHAPRYVRAMLYDYRFTTPEEREETGAWWVRTPALPYAPAVSLPSPN